MTTASRNLESVQATETFGAEIGRRLRIGDTVALRGTLGAGKTTLARGIMHGLGFDAEVPSPSFAIVQQYEPPETRLPIAHVDFYRIEDPREIVELGLDEILQFGAMIAEWPEHHPDFPWTNGLQIEMKIKPDDTRLLTWQAGPAWKDRWPPT
ncbi:tRNA threonylcarbamoyladenosine biosynthesis protein TsaE [Parasphingorhabdus marina DSM 22363]|uniref:tRNA threonylcarbamoyladenosine biosynthesis protein TsaE n=1 Tax=Parasphingorhabdus marina DSM 22363 TaxID=1123272 RepID=A0A1N6FXI3_9SPHN|nr:tRNA (adenosine(37)-N6)-threonylcarbamoyltransferase complex ATPase subunit type 1 TsaE [Parasphingorhabdus marina]SIO00015.1 tRNA threonylcarbamoyladenosine biosynthesis protein TsaE [Parasphingorhabdus marina DSM 22363]